MIIKLHWVTPCTAIRCLSTGHRYELKKISNRELILCNMILDFSILYRYYIYTAAIQSCKFFMKLFHLISCEVWRQSMAVICHTEKKLIHHRQSAPTTDAESRHSSRSRFLRRFRSFHTLLSERAGRDLKRLKNQFQEHCFGVGFNLALHVSFLLSFQTTPQKASKTMEWRETVGAAIRIHWLSNQQLASPLRRIVHRLKAPLIYILYTLTNQIFIMQQEKQTAHVHRHANLLTLLCDSSTLITDKNNTMFMCFRLCFTLLAWQKWMDFNLSKSKLRWRVDCRQTRASICLSWNSFKRKSQVFN